MTAARDIAALQTQLLSLEETRRVLAARLELTVNALATTLDAQASTQLRIDASTAPRGTGEDKCWENLHRRREAERYRTVLRLLAADGEGRSDAMSRHS
jgi:hypothetical protein